MGEFIERTRFPKHRDWIRFVVRKEWKNVYRISMDNDMRKVFPGDVRANAKQYREWCNENLSGKYSMSDGLEVVYFENLSDQIMFKLNFAGLKETA